MYKFYALLNPYLRSRFADTPPTAPAQMRTRRRTWTNRRNPDWGSRWGARAPCSASCPPCCCGPGRAGCSPGRGSPPAPGPRCSRIRWPWRGCSSSWCRGGRWPACRGCRRSRCGGGRGRRPPRAPGPAAGGGRGARAAGGRRASPGGGSGWWATAGCRSCGSSCRTRSSRAHCRGAAGRCCRSPSPAASSPRRATRRSSQPRPRRGTAPATPPRSGPSLKQGRKERFYLTTHSTHFIYSYMASDIW